MTHTTKPLVIANWKMNPATLVEAKNIYTGSKLAAKKYPTVQVVVAAPALYLLELQKLQKNTALTLGAQTMHEAVSGAHTGELSAAMLVSAGVASVIVGHSERRMLGEDDTSIGRKVLAALKAKLMPIVCVGERERDTQGNFYAAIESQIKTALALAPQSRLKDVVIAYEPIWAIGTGKTATVDDICEMKLFIQKCLTKQYSRSIAARVRIIYGGSVTAENAVLLFEGGTVDGFLVGGASLKPEEFTKIIAATS